MAVLNDSNGEKQEIQDRHMKMHFLVLPIYDAVSVSAKKYVYFLGNIYFLLWVFVQVLFRPGSWLHWFIWQEIWASSIIANCPCFMMLTTPQNTEADQGQKRYWFSNLAIENSCFFVTNWKRNPGWPVRHSPRDCPLSQSLCRMDAHRKLPVHRTGHRPHSSPHHAAEHRLEPASHSKTSAYKGSNQHITRQQIAIRAGDCPYSESLLHTLPFISSRNPTDFHKLETWFPEALNLAYAWQSSSLIWPNNKIAFHTEGQDFFCLKPELWARLFLDSALGAVVVHFGRA